MKIAGKLTGRKCYDHLGGKLGALLFDRMMEENWIKLAEDRSTVYELTEVGNKKLSELGIFTDEGK
jgi:hypothetical protein